MAKRILNEQQMIDIIWGATLLGGGGGGSMKSGIDLLNKYKSDHPDKPLAVTLYDSDEMDPNAFGAVTAGMGAPTAIKDVDFSTYATNAFMALKEMAAKMNPPRSLEYSLAVELGGFNTFVPMLISLVNDIPFIDADGAGRAVPALTTLLLNVNGCDTSPLALADGENNQATILLKDPKNAQLGEDLGRHISMVFNSIAGLSGWMLKQEDVKERIADGTITLCEKVGRVMRECAEKGQNAFEKLAAANIAECRPFCTGKVTKAETLMADGFDYGKVFITADNGDWIIYFQNENLLIERNGKNIMTVPDIIATYNATTGEPLTNADIYEGMDICVGAIVVHEKWWKNPDMFQIWKPYLDRVGYTGDNIPYSK